MSGPMEWGTDSGCKCSLVAMLPGRFSGLAGFEFQFFVCGNDQFDREKSKFPLLRGLVYYGVLIFSQNAPFISYWVASWSKGGIDEHGVALPGNHFDNDRNRSGAIADIEIKEAPFLPSFMRAMSMG